MGVPKRLTEMQKRFCQYLVFGGAEGPVNKMEAAELAGASHVYHGWAVAVEERRVATVAVLQDESRWRRRRPLALIREQRRAVRDAGLVHKEWERQQEEEEETKKKQKRK